MIEYLRRNAQFATMILFWLAAGMVAKEAGIIVVSLSVLLLKRKSMYAEMISGFILVLVLSDSKLESLEFAEDVKTIYLILLTLFFIFDRKEFTLKQNFFLPFIPFMIWAVAQIIRNPDMDVSAQKTLSYGLLFLVAPSYLLKVFHEKGTLFIKDHVYLMSYMLLTGLVFFVVMTEKVLVGSRYSGVMGNPNGIGLFCTLFFLLYQCAVIKFPNLFSRNEKIFVYALIGITVLLSGSRNAILSIGIFLFFTRFYKISPILGAGIVVLTAIIYQLVVSNLTEILQALGLAEALRADTLESGSGRIVAWAWAWKLINSSMPQFFLGKGFGYDEFYFIISKPILSKLGHIGGVHNSYLAIWINTGIIGLILWLVAIIRTVIKSIPKSYTALPFAYTVFFSATFEAWLMGSLNPYTISFLFTLTMIYTSTDSFPGYAQLDEISEKNLTGALVAK